MRTSGPGQKDGVGFFKERRLVLENVEVFFIFLIIYLFIIREGMGLPRSLRDYWVVAGLFREGDDAPELLVPGVKDDLCGIVHLRFC